MSRCSDIKFHGYLVGTLSALSYLLTLSVSLYYTFSKSDVPNELKGGVLVSFLDYVILVFDSIAVSLLFYGIYKENYYLLIPFIATCCEDLIVMVYQFDSKDITSSLLDAGTTVLLNTYCLFVTIRLFVLFRRPVQSNPTSNKV